MTKHDAKQAGKEAGAAVDSYAAQGEAKAKAIGSDIKDKASKAHKEAKNRTDKAVARWRSDADLRKKVFIGVGTVATTAVLGLVGFLLKKKNDGDKKILPGK